jgi:hypothetical protein
MLPMMALTINKPNAETKIIKHIFVFMLFPLAVGFLSFFIDYH